MIDDESALLRKTFRREFLKKLAAVEQTHGKSVAVLYADSVLEAITLHLQGSVGPSVAYQHLRRQGDLIAGVLTQSAAGHQ